MTTRNLLAIKSQVAPQNEFKVVDTDGNITINLGSDLVDTNVRSDLADTSDVAKGAALVGYKHPGTGGVARNLYKKAQEIVSDKDFGDGAAAIQSAVNEEKRFDVFSTTIDSVVTGDSYFSVVGRGDSTPVTVTASTGISYAFASGNTFDDHSRKEFRNLRLLGNTSNTLLHNAAGSYMSHRDMTYDQGQIGARIASFVNDGFKNHYRSNALYGLWLDGVTAYTEREIYARGHSDSAGAAVYISGAPTENVRLSGGAIEGNRAPAIKVDSTGFSPNRFKLHVDNVYFEVDGDAAAGTPSISIPGDMGDGAFVAFAGSKLSYNTVPWTSGPYNLGKNAIFKGTSISGDIQVDNASFLEGARLVDARLNSGQEPILVHQFTHVTWSGGRNDIGGYVFSVPVSGKSAAQSPVTNLTITAHPYCTASPTNPPTISENSLDGYGDGSWTKVVFNASMGGFNDNSVRIGNFIDATDRPYRIHVFLIKAVADATFNMDESGVGSALSHKLLLKAGKIYKIVALTNRAQNGNQSLRIYPADTSAPEIDVICLYQARFQDQFQASAFVSRLVSG